MVNVHTQKVMTFQQRGDGVLRYQGRLCVPRADELHERIRSHSSRFLSIQVPQRCIMIRERERESYWWSRINKDIAKFVANDRIVNKLRYNTKCLVVWLRI